MASVKLGRTTLELEVKDLFVDMLWVIVTLRLGGEDYAHVVVLAKEIDKFLGTLQPQRLITRETELVTAIRSREIITGGPLVLRQKQYALSVVQVIFPVKGAKGDLMDEKGRLMYEVGLVPLGYMWGDVMRDAALIQAHPEVD